MKFYNKNKKYRNTWTKVETLPWDILVAKKWCQDHPSTGRFHGHISGTWRFEFPDDALVFKLRWGQFVKNKRLR